MTDATKLWLLRPIESWSPWYDRAFGFVIRATSEGEARHIASTKSGDEGRMVWLDPKITMCEELTADGEPSVILRDFASA